MLLCSVENVDNMVQGFFETLLTHTCVNTDKQGHKANTKRDSFLWHPGGKWESHDKVKNEMMLKVISFEVPFTVPQ